MTFTTMLYICIILLVAALSFCLCCGGLAYYRKQVNGEPSSDPFHKEVDKN